jgi:K+/H+ antiporter YhaU regulatory subunit KhtT
MNIFNSEVANLQNQSDSIMNVFSYTAKKLRKLNSKITKASLEKVKRVESLNREIDSLEYAHNKNEKVASKIDQFLDN